MRLKHKSDYIQSNNLCLNGFSRNYPIISITQFPNATVYLGCSDRVWAFIDGEINPSVRKFILKQKIKYIAGIKSLQKNTLMQEYSVEWLFSSIRYSNPPLLKSPEKICNKLYVSDAEFLFQHSRYTEYSSLDYIRMQIRGFPSAGIRIENKLVAWGLIHDDDSIGFVNVIPEYRKNGFAKEITKTLVYKQQQKKRMPFLHVEPDNQAAINLFNQLGFQRNEEIYWIKLK